MCLLFLRVDQVVNRTSVKLTLSSVASQWAAEDKLGPLSITVRVYPSPEVLDELEFSHGARLCVGYGCGM